MFKSLLNKTCFTLKNFNQKPLIVSSQFHSSKLSSKGWADFKDAGQKDEIIMTGRAWTLADLRRKVSFLLNSFCVIV
jgi:hypothetical protein